MMIDDNERPEEYPSHMREEIMEQEVREETEAIPEVEEAIANHQTVADILSNGEIYPEPVTEERVRQVVEEILEENPLMEAVIRNDGLTSEGLVDIGEGAEDITPQPRAVHTVQDVRDLVTVDLANIPAGMTAEEYVTHYQTTGVLLTESTAVPTSYQTDVGTSSSTTDGQPFVSVGRSGIDFRTRLEQEAIERVNDLIDSGEVKIDEENGAEIAPPTEAPASFEEETGKQLRAKMRKANPLTYKIDAEYALQTKRVTNIANIHKKRTVYFSNREVAPNEIALDVRGNMFHSNRRGKVKVSNQFLAGELTLDKSFNLLSVIREDRQRIRRRRGGLLPELDTLEADDSRRTVPRLHERQVTGNGRIQNPTIIKYIVLDKTAFIASKAKNFKFIARNDMNMTEITEVKKRAIQGFEIVAQGINYVKDAIANILPPEDFEIIYHYRTDEGTNYMNVFLRFRDVVITNSIELQRNIGDIVVRIKVEHNMHRNRTFPYLYFTSSISGMRLSYTAIDAIAGYNHSHLPSGIEQFGSFCTGQEAYHHNEAKSLDIEQLVIRLRQFISWESLEGGPHFRMENINVIGSVRRMSNNIMDMNLPAQSYIKKMTDYISNTEQGFNAFKDCFKLINKRGNLLFEGDNKRFYLKMMEIFGNEALERLHGRGEALHYYKESEDKFYKLKTNSSRDESSFRMKAINAISKIHPIYMNGRYLKPTIIDSDNPLEGIRFCPNPEMMYVMIHVILYQLTDKLEKHGNTSEE